MKSAWKKGLEPDAAKEIQLHFNGSVQLRKRLTQMLSEKMAAKDRVAMSDVEYDIAGWAYKQADTQGYKRAMSEIISLIEK